MKILNKPKFSTKQFSSENKKMNEIILNFQPTERPKMQTENLTDFMKKKIQRNSLNNFNTNEMNLKKLKKDSEKNFDPHFYFEMDSQNKFSDDLNVNLLKYNLSHTVNNNTGNLNINSNNNNDNINNFIGINYTSNNDENIINSYNNFDLHFNTNGYSQNNFSHYNHIEKSFENDIIKKIVLERINRILSGNNLKEKLMLYMIMCKSDKVCRVENERGNEMEKLLEIIKANFSSGYHSQKVQTDIVKKIVLSFCKYLQDNNYSILKNQDESALKIKRSNGEICDDMERSRDESASEENYYDCMKNKVCLVYLKFLVCK
jgi:hypothetical protein